MQSGSSVAARRVWRTIVVVAVIGGGYFAAQHFGLFGGGDDGASKQRAKRVRVAPVLVTKAERKNVPEIEQTIGTVEAAAIVQVKSRVEGQIQQAFFNGGDLVKKGDLLFRIDPRPFQAALAQAQAVLARDQAQAVNAKANVSRYGNLSSKGYASAQQYEQAEAQSKALVATLAADRAAIQIATLNLGYTEIRSPIDGKTGAILIHPGNLVKANGDAALVTVTQIRPVRVSFTLPQQDLPRLQQRMATNSLVALASIPGDKAPPLSAKVDFMDNQVNATTGTIALRATFDNADGRLVPGQFVNVSLEITRFENAITLPRDAINAGQHGAYVYVVKPNHTAVVQPVTVSYQTDKFGVVSSGLEGGETVVVDGQLRLAPGMKVRIQPANGGGRRPGGPPGDRKREGGRPGARDGGAGHPAAADAQHGRGTGESRERKDRRS